MVNEVMALPDLIQIWRKLSDVGCDDNGQLVEQFEHFQAGTPKEEVWHWFESQNPEFSVYDAQNGDYDPPAHHPYYRVCINVNVHDVKALHETAVANYRADNYGRNEEDIEQELNNILLNDNGSINVHACLIQIFDPGMSPEGCSIEGSEVE